MFEMWDNNLYINLRRSRDVVVRGGQTYGRTVGRSLWRPAVGSIQLVWADFTLTVHINALYNESVHGKEEHAT